MLADRIWRRPGPVLELAYQPAVSRIARNSSSNSAARCRAPVALASIEDIERLWFELQREVGEQGKIVKFNHEIATAQTANVVTEQIARVGVFNLAYNGGYLSYDSDHWQRQ